MALSFPDIMKPSYPLGQEIEDNSLRSKFDDGSMQSRRKFTRSRAKYIVTWDSLPQKEYDILYNFITKEIFYSAVSFLWTNPATEKEIEVRLTNVTDVELTTINYWKITLELTEV